MNIKYIRVGDYYIPDLKLPELPSASWNGCTRTI